MNPGDLIYTNSIEARNRPGPKPELRMTFKVNDKNKSFVFLCLGQTDKPWTQADLDKFIEDCGYVKK